MRLAQGAADTYKPPRARAKTVRIRTYAEVCDLKADAPGYVSGRYFKTATGSGGLSQVRGVGRHKDILRCAIYLCLPIGASTAKRLDQGNL